MEEKHDQLSTTLTTGELRVAHSLVDIAKKHDPSGCSYSMVAAYIKGSRRIIGKNKLPDPARLKRKIYNEYNGMHGELAVILRAEALGYDLCGGTLYVVGVRVSRNHNRMQNTRPCFRCQSLIDEETKIRALIYLKDGQFVKEFL